jgi:hypothetical protein
MARMPNRLKGKTTKPSSTAAYQESSDQDVERALAAMRAYPGVARLDGYQNYQGFLRITWAGLSHAGGGGVVVTTKDWTRYTAVFKLASTALSLEAKRAIASTPRKPVASEGAKVVPSQRKKR